MVIHSFHSNDKLDGDRIILKISLKLEIVTLVG